MKQKLQKNNGHSAKHKSLVFFFSLVVVSRFPKKANSEENSTSNIEICFHCVQLTALRTVVVVAAAF